MMYSRYSIAQHANHKITVGHWSISDQTVADRLIAKCQVRNVARPIDDHYLIRREHCRFLTEAHCYVAVARTLFPLQLTTIRYQLLWLQWDWGKLWIIKSFCKEKKVKLFCLVEIHHASIWITVNISSVMNNKVHVIKTSMAMSIQITLMTG